MAAFSFFVSISALVFLCCVSGVHSQTEIRLNDTAVTGSLSTGAPPLQYFIAVPVDPVSKESTSFYIAMKTSDECYVNTTIYYPSPSWHPFSLVRVFPGVSSLYDNEDDIHTDNVGTWNFTVEAINGSCSFSLWAVQVPTQQLAFNQGYEYALVPDSRVHYQIGDGSAAVSAFIVNFTVPLSSPGCFAYVGADNVKSEEGDSQFIPHNSSAFFTFLGVFSSVNTTYGSDWSVSGFFPPAATPIDLVVGGAYNDSAPCDFIFSVSQYLPKQISIGQAPDPIQGPSSVSLFSIAAPSSTYSVTLKYMQGYCTDISWGANSQNWNGDAFEIAGFVSALNSVNSTVTIPGQPSSSTVIWAVRAYYSNCYVDLFTS